MKFNVKDRVNLPFGEIGIIQNINIETLDWFPYKVKIEKGTFNKINEILEFKEEQLELINNYLSIKEVASRYGEHVECNFFDYDYSWKNVIKIVNANFLMEMERGNIKEVKYLL